MTKSFLLAGMVASMVATASAQSDAGAPALPTPAPELTSFMKDVVGTWTCVSTFAPNAFGPGSPELKTSSKIKFSKEPALGGFFYRADYTIAKGKGMPAGISGYLQVGYDAVRKLAVSIGADNMGTASFGTGALTENSVSWTGDSHVTGVTMKFRETFTKTGPKQMTNTFEVDVGQGLQKMGENVCKR